MRMHQRRQNVLIQGLTIGRKIAKAWLMKPRAKAGNSCEPGVKRAIAHTRPTAMPAKPKKKDEWRQARG